MRIITDPKMTVGYRAWAVEPPRLSMVVIVKQLYALTPGVLAPFTGDDPYPAGDVHLDDNPEASLRYSSDLGIRKPRADVLLVGCAQAPGGEMVGMLQPELRVGTVVRKQLAVWGDREWKVYGPSDPKPFQKMPITFERAWGGKGFKRNPVGRGRTDAAVDAPPNIEDPRRLCKARADSLEPVGFGPIAPAWEPRASMVGSRYGGDYVAKRWPWFAEDFDYAHFNAAPPDQQVDGYLRGDEEIVLINLRPESKEFRTRLPGRRARCLVVMQPKGGTESQHDVRLDLDTLWIDAEAGVVALVWRGLIDAMSMKLREVEKILACTEPLAAPLGGAPELRAEFERRLLALDEDPPDMKAAEAELAVLEAKAEKDAEEAKAQSEVFKAEMEAMIAASGKQPPAPKPQDPDPSGLRWARAQVEAQLQGLLVKGAAPGDPEVEKLKAKLEAIDTNLPTVEAMLAQPTRESVRQAVVAGQSLAEVTLAKLDLSGLDLSGADLSQCTLQEVNLKGAVLRSTRLTNATVYKCDFTGADLSGADVSGVFFAESQMQGITWKGARLVGATISGLALPNADFAGCQAAESDFARCDLTNANFAGAVLSKSNFSGATLDGADFTGANLSEADLGAVKADSIVFRNADLTKLRAGESAGLRFADFSGARAEGASFAEAALDGADFSDAALTGALLTGASLYEALLRRTVLRSADISDADMRRAIVDTCDLFHAILERSDFTDARVSGCSAQGAGFWGAKVRDGEFGKNNMKGTLLA